MRTSGNKKSITDFLIHYLKDLLKPIFTWKSNINLLLLWIKINFLCINCMVYHFTALSALSYPHQLEKTAQIWHSYIVCIEVSPPPPLPLFLAKSPLKSANCPSPPFLGNSHLLHWFFVNPPNPLKIGFFSEPQNIKVFHH